MLKGSIRIGVDHEKPERLTVEGFQGYDRVKLEDGTVFIVKTAKALCRPIPTTNSERGSS